MRDFKFWRFLKGKFLYYLVSREEKYFASTNIFDLWVVRMKSSEALKHDTDVTGTLNKKLIGILILVFSGNSCQNALEIINT